MSLTADQITAQNFKDFYNHIMPYLNGQPALNYSTDEQVVGTWIDGKPLYQKTIDFGALPNNTTKTVAHNISNVGIILDIIGTIYNTSAQRSYCIPWVAKDESVNMATVDADTENIRVMTNGDRTTSIAFITLRYTKNTD